MYKGMKRPIVFALLAVVWSMLVMAQPRPERAVEPLLRTKRVQTAPFNNSCPYYNYGDSVSTERCLVGCVATCIEQLLSHYRYPDALLDSIPGWTTPNYSLATVPAGSRIDWEDETAADLSLWCGMMVQMKYSPDASASSLWNAEEPLQRIFGYKTAKVLDRSLYTFDDWHRILQNELLCGRPVAYVGYSNAVRAHAFNIDGVNEEGLYHVNWGEGENAMYDGYFTLEHLAEMQPQCDETPWGRMFGNHANQYMLVLHPDSVIDVLQPDTLEDFAHAARVDDISFHRTITNREYVLTDVTLTNLTPDTLYQTFVVMQNALTDTALVEQGRMLAFSSARLLPHATHTETVAVHYTATKGRWLVGLTFDGLEVPYTKEVEVEQAVADQLSVPEAPVVTFPDPGTASISLKISNDAPTGDSGRLLYFMLYGGEATSPRSTDYRVLNLPAGDTIQDTLLFRGLQPGQRYRLHIGTWSTAMHNVHFTMPEDETGIDEVSIPSSQGSEDTFFDLSGRVVYRPHAGMYIRNGKKVVLP